MAISNIIVRIVGSRQGFTKIGDFLVSWCSFSIVGSSFSWIREEHIQLMKVLNCRKKSGYKINQSTISRWGTQNFSFAVFSLLWHLRFHQPILHSLILFCCNVASFSRTFEHCIWHGPSPSVFSTFRFFLLLFLLHIEFPLVHSCTFTNLPCPLGGEISPSFKFTSQTITNFACFLDVLSPN